MNSRNLFGLSLALNLVSILIGSIYLIGKIDFLEPHPVKEPGTLQHARSAMEERFVSTLDYQWPKQLFEEEPIQNRAIVFLGDSLTAGGLWQYVWRGKTEHPVLNRGLVGDTMDGVIARMDEVLRHHPSKILIMIGINDLRFQHKSPGELVSQYEILLHQVNEKSPQTRVYLQSLLPALGATNTAVAEVNRQLSELADGRRVHYIDIHSMMADSESQLRKDWTFDGVHLRAIGYQRWRAFVWPLLN